MDEAIFLLAMPQAGVEQKTQTEMLSFRDLAPEGILWGLALASQTFEIQTFYPILPLAESSSVIC